MKVSDHTSTFSTSSDKNTKTKIVRQYNTPKKKYSCFEWIQLIATVCIPLIITVYSIIENNNNESIAAAGRRKDIQISEANRLSEITIAEQSRQKDRDLAVDQQRENILVEYQKFLTQLILDNGMTLNKSSTAKTVAKSVTLTTLSQLDTKRKGILLRFLYNYKLITLDITSKPYDDSIILLGHVDLSEVTFSSSSTSQDGRL